MPVLSHSDAVAREYFRDAPEHHDLGARYLRDNISTILAPTNAPASSCSIATLRKSVSRPVTRRCVFFEGGLKDPPYVNT